MPMASNSSRHGGRPPHATTRSRARPATTAPPVPPHAAGLDDPRYPAITACWHSWAWQRGRKHTTRWQPGASCRARRGTGRPLDEPKTQVFEAGPGVPGAGSRPRGEGKTSGGDADQRNARRGGGRSFVEGGGAGGACRAAVMAVRRPRSLRRRLRRGSGFDARGPGGEVPVWRWGVVRRLRTLNLALRALRAVGWQARRRPEAGSEASRAARRRARGMRGGIPPPVPPREPCEKIDASRRVDQHDPPSGMARHRRATHFS